MKKRHAVTPPLHLDLRQLRMVSAISDCGSVTRAARSLHLTQSALSHQLRDLELRLGAPLFLRVNRRMAITGAGEHLLATARRVIGEVERVEGELLRGEFAGDSGVIRIATECYTAYHWLPRILNPFRVEWPRVEVRIVPEMTARPAAALLEGSLDVAILQREIRDKRLSYTTLFEDELVLICHPRHRLASQAYVRLESLATEHLILYTTPHSESSVLKRVLRPAGVEPRRISQVQLTEAILELVKADLGVSVLARWAIAPQLAAGTIAAVRLTRSGITRRWVAARRNDTAEVPYLNAFVALLAARAFAQAGAPESSQVA